ncbi:carotenoid biosynthesis protein [Ilyomonas limi]|uniref:Carotenoid biosynthesis protein n=1 Tax=Ilyomonas limi TaxID=2575867 RepID=A0A4U3L7B9_9BACT|nr:carotenoid biosynthesis protein [Ilyomonas limi]TKK70922.1 carotenoid biosynthesis protein [Ilyomonas limi]
MHTKRLFTLQHIALFVVLLFHVSGAIGILYTPYKDWFVQNTPLNLLIMAVLLIITQLQKNISFFLFFATACITGFVVELIGVGTGHLFGNYQYGKVLGIQYDGVPLLIGINWFIIMYCTGIISQSLQSWSTKQLAVMQAEVKPSVQFISFITDGALLATLFDFVMEPVAVRLGYWQWLGNGDIPLYNYTCWFVISMLLLAIFKLLPFEKNNPLAVHLFIIQLLFFLLLRTFL